MCTVFNFAPRVQAITSIVFGEMYEGSLRNNELAQYQFNVNGGDEHYVIEIMSTTDPSSLDIEIRKPDGTVEKSVIETRYFRYFLNRPSPGTWLINVEGRRDGTNHYKLIVNKITGSSSGAFQNRVSSGSTKTHTIYISDGRALVNITMRSLTNDDIRFRIFNPNGFKVYESTSYHSNDVRKYIGKYLMPGTWTIEVCGENIGTSTGDNYRIEYNLLNGMQSYPSSSMTVNLQQERFGGYVNAGSTRRFHVFVPSTSVALLALGLYSSTADDIKVSVFNPNGFKVYESMSEYNTDLVSYYTPFPMPGIWTIEVYGANLEYSGHFTAWIHLSRGLTPTPANETTLSNDWAMGYVNQGEQMIYYVNVPSGTTRLIVYLESLSDDDIKLYLYDPHGSYSYTTSYHKDDVSYIDKSSPTSGTWTIKVYGYAITHSGAFHLMIIRIPSFLSHTPSDVIIIGTASPGTTNTHNVPVPSGLSLMLTILESRTDRKYLKMTLFTPKIVQFDYVQYSFGSIIVHYPVQGTWRIEIHNPSTSDTVEYAIHVIFIEKKLVMPLYNLTLLPAPFVIKGVADVTFVVGDTDGHGPFGWGAATADVVGAIRVAGEFGRHAYTGVLESVIDMYFTSLGSSVTVDWSKITTSTVVCVGGPGVNLLTYYYNGTAPFFWKYKQGKPSYIWSSLTKTGYQGKPKQGYDYAIVHLHYDSSVGKHILIIWGMSRYGSQAACLLIQHPEAYPGVLEGLAVIIKWEDTNGNSVVDLGDTITQVECWRG